MSQCDITGYAATQQDPKTTRWSQQHATSGLMHQHFSIFILNLSDSFRMKVSYEHVRLKQTLLTWEKVCERPA